MGCSTSSSRQQAYTEPAGAPGSPPTLLAGRRLTVNGAISAGIAEKTGRRLTVTGAGAAGMGKGQVGSFTEEEKTIDQSEILSLLQEVVTKGVGNCASFSSRLDPNMKESFKNKLTSKNGVLDNKSIGFACKKGLKPRSPNQDAWAVVQGGDEFSMYLVCDGHGTDGHIISDLAINMIPKFILTCPNFKENLSEVMKRTFQRMHEFIVKSASAAGFDADLSGATSTIVFHDKQLHRITIAHVGDSGSLIGKRADGSSEVKAKVLVEDHKPENPEERARIESRGGRVEWDGYANHRVYGGTTDAPGINMSRALGDDLGHRIAGISYEPTVTIYDLEPEDRFLCVCSDGVWEFLKPDQVAKDMDAGKNVMDSCEKITKKAWDCWIKEERGEVVDDITALMIKLPPVTTT